MDKIDNIKSMNEQGYKDAIEKLTNRHIARLLSKLGETVAPVIQQEIKKEIRYLSDDILKAYKDKSYEEKTNQQTSQV